MLDKAYDPKAVEDRIYTMWEDSGAFIADASSKKEPFTISLPPPNATGQLHLGHAIMLALEDIFIRFARMNGKEALWVPGTDHAAIATESVVIKKLKAEGMKDPRKELGREKLIEKIAEFVDGSQNTIRSQVRKMGSSCDWSRERYTFEPALNRLVNEVFVKMYNDGLIYRGHRIVNWDPKLQTTVSDDELEYKEETIPFHTFKYGPFEIATSRPETKFGDKYVVMHPDDERYAQYKHGDTFEAEWINGPVKATVIKDSVIDPAFGTGVMTITPWHDTIDFGIAERHNLEKQQVIDEAGKLMAIAEEFQGMHIDDARPLIVEKLSKKGLVVSTVGDYVHNKAVNSRGGGTIEPQIKLQWFVDVNKPVVDWKGKKMSLKEVMLDVVQSGDVKIIPDRFEKTYFHWIENLRDWCISRQIWWGHRIPVWYRGDETYVGAASPEGDGWTQDPDTLDTWFSSGLWTWSTLVDPKLTEDYALSLGDMLRQSPDFQKFHPTSVMETGYDILFFWVARMILMTTYATGEVPFEVVYLHGLVRTKDGKKMSKSDPSTMIDPLEIIPKYGADALRLSMIVGQSPGADSKLYDEKIAGYRNFINKLWNACRFILLECEKAGIDPRQVDKVEAKSLADKALTQELGLLIKDVTTGIEEYRLSETGERLYAFTWDFLCDWYLELSKGGSTGSPQAGSTGSPQAGNPALLVETMRNLLALLHPYCPFVTEELWAQFGSVDSGPLIRQEWPKAFDAGLRKDRADLQRVIDVVTTLRQIRSENDVEPGKELMVTIVTGECVELFESQAEHIKRLAKVADLKIVEKAEKPTNAASAFLPDIEIHVSLEGLFDAEKAKASLGKEQESLRKFVAGIEAKLSNEQFVARAPAAVIDEQKAKLADAKEKLEKVEERLKGI